MLFDKFSKGVNIGGWLSQYDCRPNPPETREEMAEHLETYMTEKDFAQIRSWGLDHVRLTLDHRDFEPEPDSLMDADTAFHYMDLCVDWCEKYGLNVIIDLHRAAGVAYDMTGDPMPLVADEACRLRFIHIWERIAEHFKGRNTPVLMFDLLNEVCDSSGYLWIELYERTVAAIRKIDKERYILTGSNEQNSVFRLKELKLLDDDHVFYNFHFYDPLMFTHQKAHFSEDMKRYNQDISYPGEIPGFAEYLRENREYIPKFSHVILEDRVDKESMRRLLKDAADFVKYTGKELYCGEIGVIDTVPAKDAADWINDCAEILRENHIGFAIWNYKEMDFGFVNIRNEVSEERVERIFGKKCSS